MLYKQRKDTYIRTYDGLGYITSTGIFNDLVVNKGGAVFLCALSREPQTLEQLTDKILPQFVGVDRNTILSDAQEFYTALAADGFVVMGETEADLNAKDTGFTYHAVQPKTIRKDFSPVIQRADSTTQEYLEKHFAGTPHLTHFQLELTSKCNERCVHCYIPHKFKLYNISEPLYHKALEQAADMGLLALTLSGGEPMLHPQFVKFLKVAKDYDFYVNILSNLTLLNNDIVKVMRGSNVSSVQVSLYSMKQSITMR